MIVERTDKEVIVRLPGDTDIEELQEILNWLEFREITKKSKASQADVHNLVKEAKKGRWEKTKSILGK